MEVHIFDVEHGNCAAIIMPSGELMLIDCGHNSTTGWRPSNWVINNYGGVINNLTISNFDEDHVSDLPNVLSRCSVESLKVNHNVPSDWVRRAKAQYGMGPGIRALVGAMDNTFTGSPYIYGWGGADVSRFCLSPIDFNDENSLSVVTFVHYKGIGIVFPGDLSRAAWLKLLENPQFRSKLNATNIFVASHHGREDGYCREVFDYCSPAIVIISDESIRYDTQDVKYAQHATGVIWDTGETRRVLTTRKHGKIKIAPWGQNNMSFWITVG